MALAVEGCTGWRYVVEEITAAGFEAHVAETADTKAARSRKHRAKTDRTDARLLRELLAAGELPESWIPPTVVLEWRERVRLYKSLIDQRTEWCQRIHAELFHHGVSVPEGAIRSAAVRARIADKDVQLSPAARQRIRVGYQMIEATDTEALPLKAALTRFGLRQPACRALVDAQYGIGGLLAVAVWCELGDCRRFSRSRQAVRHTGLDVTVDASNRRRGWISGSPRSGDVAVGVVRSCEELVTSAQSRPRLLRQAEGPSWRQDRCDLGRASVHTPLLSHSAQHRFRGGVHHGDLTLTASDGVGRLFHIRVVRDQLPKGDARQHSCWTALQQ